MSENKIEGITEKLIAQADQELKREIEQATRALDDLLRNGRRNTIQVWPENRKDEDPQVLVNARAAFDALKEKAFEIQQQARRQKKLDEFMSKVESLGQEIDELRDSIQQ